MNIFKTMHPAARLISTGLVLGSLAFAADAAAATGANPQFDIPLAALAPLLVIPACLLVCLALIVAPRFLKRRPTIAVLRLRALRTGKARLA